MNKELYIKIAEAIIFTSDKPVSIRSLTNRLPETTDISFIIDFLLNKYKEGGELLKHKGLFISLIDILGFINKFSSSSNNLDEKTKNYITAIHDKLDIVLINSGVEKFSPEINKNLLEINGCSPSIETKKTKDKNKVNLISSVIKPGYKLQTKENEFIVLKNSEVQVYELEN